MRRSLMTLLAAAPLMLPTAAVASPPGQTDPSDPDYTAPTRSGMVAEQRGNPNDDVTAQEFSPAGCYGQSNYPHVSTSSGTRGDIKGYAKSACQFKPDRLYVKAGVWQKRWWGWQQKGEERQGSATRVYSIGRSGWYNGCIEDDWRTVGNHYSVELGEKYTAETMNWHDNLQC